MNGLNLKNKNFQIFQNVFFKLIFNPHLWVILILSSICTVLHYPQEIPFINDFEFTSFLGFNRHAIERIFFLVPITYSVFIFGIKGGIINLIIALIIMLPRALFISHYPKDALFETSLVVFIGFLINWLFEYRRREIINRKKLQTNLRLYSNQISGAYENERKRISRELHDDTIQTMIATSRNIENLISKNITIPQKERKSLEKIKKNIEESLIRLRRFVQNLRPPTLDHLGLLPALRELANKTQEFSGIKITLNSKLVKCKLAPEKELLIYRIVQEAICNVTKHSAAKEAKINITSDEKKIIIEINDNGQGFITNNNSDFLEKGKLGLMGMQERANLLGGSLYISSKLGIGTNVTLNVPY